MRIGLSMIILIIVHMSKKKKKMPNHSPVNLLQLSFSWESSEIQRSKNIWKYTDQCEWVENESLEIVFQQFILFPFLLVSSLTNIKNDL